MATANGRTPNAHSTRTARYDVYFNGETARLMYRDIDATSFHDAYALFEAGVNKHAYFVSEYAGEGVNIHCRDTDEWMLFSDGD